VRERPLTKTDIVNRALQVYAALMRQVRETNGELRMVRWPGADGEELTIIVLPSEKKGALDVS
jgi:hypothetical protein